MSTSLAPAATASRVSRSLTSSDVWPDGKPVATEATATPVPRSASAATATSAGYTHTAATEGISGRAGSGTTAFAHRCRTLPGVSEPSSVVRSIIDVAMRMPSRLAVVLIERLPRAAARSSTPTRLTGMRERLMEKECGTSGGRLRLDGQERVHHARGGRARGPALQPRQGLLPQAGLDEARPRRVLPGRRRRRARPPARAPDGDEALR